MNIRELITDCIIISQSVFLLWHFSNIWRYGSYLVEEPNGIIRTLETVLIVFILAFGVSRFINNLRKGQVQKGDGS